jgi:BirA family biotin operon repressor/biotin-[acetyl-CoA-carboxylase] ligase
MYIKIINLNEVDSTNTCAEKLAIKGAKEITVVRAHAQHKGRGRFHRQWFSPAGRGIYVSFLLRPQSVLKQVYYLPLFSALSVARVFKKFIGSETDTRIQSLDIRIKLPNDILIAGKKAAGVLVEAKITGKSVDFIIVGIGVNINSTQRQLPGKATSLYLETGKSFEIEKFFKLLLNEFIAVYKDFKHGHITALVNEARLYQKGKPVESPKQLLKEEERKQAVMYISNT